MKQQLSEHFSLEELIHSATATARGICNQPYGEAVSNLQNLCQQVLEPLRTFAGQPVVISSGYRCHALNRAVGGAKGSQHCRGEAADIAIPDIATGRRWFEWIRHNCPFDQLIWEQKGGKTWIHVSCRRQDDKNRKQVMTIRKP